MDKADYMKDGRISKKELKAFLDRLCRGHEADAEDIEAQAILSNLDHINEEKQKKEEELKKIVFNDQIFKILCDKLNANSEGRYLIDEFVQAYMEGEMKLLERSK